MDRRNFLTQTIGTTAILATASSYGCSLQAGKPNNHYKNRIIREAHRGANLVFPENTLPAFEEAIKTGVDRIELDLRISADGYLYVFHDDELGRTTNGQGDVSGLTIAELKKLDAGAWKSPEFKGLKIPTLEEVFNLAKGKCFVNIDLKEAAAAQPMAKLANEMGMADNIVITGKIPECIEPIRETGNTITMFYEFSDSLAGEQPAVSVNKIKEKQLPGCLANFKNVSRMFVHECKLHGLSVSVWGVLTEQDMRNMISIGVDSIMVDDIQLLNTILNEA